MEHVYDSRRLHFSVEGQAQQVLQLVLFPGQLVVTKLPFVVYSSPALNFRHSRRPRDKSGLDYCLLSGQQAPAYLGLALPTGGRILGLATACLRGELLVLESCLLCYAHGVYFEPE